MSNELKLGNDVHVSFRQTGKSLNLMTLHDHVWKKVSIEATIKQSIHEQLMATCRLAEVPDTYRNITDDVVKRYQYWLRKMEYAWNTAIKEPMGATAHVRGFLAMISVWNFPTVNKAMEILLDVKNIPDQNKCEGDMFTVSFMAQLNDLLSLGIAYPELRIIEYFDLITPAFENSLFVFTVRNAGARQEKTLRLVGLTQPKLTRLLYRVTESKLEYGHFESLMRRFATKGLSTYVTALLYQALQRRLTSTEKYLIQRDTFDFHIWSMANQWIDKISSVVVNEEDGTTIRVHHHSVYWQIAQEYERDGRIIYGGVERSVQELVHNFNPKSSPKRFYADIVKSIAQKIYEKYSDMVFADYSEILRNKVDGIHYIPTALEVLKEGDVMGHCVGGEAYVSGCVEGDVIVFHADSIDCPYGLTVALDIRRLSLYSITEEEHYTHTSSFDIKGENCTYRLTINDLKGRYNREPSTGETDWVIQKLTEVFGLEPFNE